MAHKKKLDIKLMMIGGKKLLGTKDFTTFRASNCGAKSSIKTLKSLKIKVKGEKIEIQFKSKSFLKQQVRSMVGCLKYLGEKNGIWKNLKSYEFKKKILLCTTCTTSWIVFTKSYLLMRLFFGNLN